MSETPNGIPPEVIAWMIARTKERGPVPKPEAIFRHALGFHECALRCLEFRDGHGFIFQSSIVLFAFVVEIYLKGLLSNEGKDTRSGGHNLEKVFASLGGEIQAQISDRYEKRHKQKLEGDLPGYARLFVDHRYPYELEGAHETDLSGVAQLAAVLYETWAELRPDLIKPGVLHDRVTAPMQGIPITDSKADRATGKGKH